MKNGSLDVVRLTELSAVSQAPGRIVDDTTCGADRAGWRREVTRVRSDGGGRRFGPGGRRSQPPDRQDAAWGDADTADYLAEGRVLRLLCADQQARLQAGTPPDSRTLPCAAEAGWRSSSQYAAGAALALFLPPLSAAVHNVCS